MYIYETRIYLNMYILGIQYNIYYVRDRSEKSNTLLSRDCLVTKSKSTGGGTYNIHTYTYVGIRNIIIIRYMYNVHRAQVGIYLNIQYIHTYIYTARVHRNVLITL